MGREYTDAQKKATYIWRANHKEKYQQLQRTYDKKYRTFKNAWSELRNLGNLVDDNKISN